MAKGYYKCECGKEFDNPQKFNGHKSHCLVHNELNGKTDYLLETDRARHSKTSETLKKAFEEKRESVKISWVSEQHTCEKCGKIMTEKFGSGRFCSRVCANSRVHSNETKEKISKSVATAVAKSDSRMKNNRSYNESLYNEHPKLCRDCGKQLTYDERHKDRCKVCAKIYSHKLRSNKSKELAASRGGNINICGVRGCCKYGTYNNIHCDSSWELAFVYYCVKNSIAVERNYNGFPYIKNGEEHLYYPDFMVEGTLVEIKNYWTEDVQLKIDAIPDECDYKILYKQDIKKYLDYVVEIEGKNFCEKLYDRSQPSYLDKVGVNK